MTALSLFNSVNLSGGAISVAATISFWFIIFLIVQTIILQFREISYRIVGNRKTTSDLHQEFNNESMTKNRNKAHGYIKINFDRTIDSILDEYTRSRDDDKIMSLITIMRFYQRMNALIKDGAIRRETTFNLFAETYIWWYECYLHKGFESWETAHSDLIELHLWFYNYSHRKLPPLR